MPRGGGQGAGDRCKRLLGRSGEKLWGVQCRGWSVPLIVCLRQETSRFLARGLDGVNGRGEHAPGRGIR